MSHWRSFETEAFSNGLNGGNRHGDRIINIHTWYFQKHNVIATCTCFQLMFYKSSAVLIELFPFYCRLYHFHCVSVYACGVFVFFSRLLLLVVKFEHSLFFKWIWWSVNLESLYLIGSAFSEKRHFWVEFRALAMPMLTLYAIDFIWPWCYRFSTSIKIYLLLSCPGCVSFISHSYRHNSDAKIEFCFCAWNLYTFWHFFSSVSLNRTFRYLWCIMLIARYQCAPSEKKEKTRNNVNQLDTEKAKRD